MRIHRREYFRILKMPCNPSFSQFRTGGTFNARRLLPSVSTTQKKCLSAMDAFTKCEEIMPLIITSVFIYVHVSFQAISERGKTSFSKLLILTEEQRFLLLCVFNLLVNLDAQSS
jgi:hypothetical protein